MEGLDFEALGDMPRTEELEKANAVIEQMSAELFAMDAEKKIKELSEPELLKIRTAALNLCAGDSYLGMACAALEE